VEASSGKSGGGVTRDEVKNILLEALADVAESLRKAN